MKFYVASSLKNWKRIREIYRELILAGHEITFDWTKFAETMYGEGCDPVFNYDPDHLGKAAVHELTGVAACDILLLVPEGGRGTYFEFGFAYASTKRVMILGTVASIGVQPVSFHHLPHVDVFESVGDVLRTLDEENAAPNIRKTGNGCHGGCGAAPGV